MLSCHSKSQDNDLPPSSPPFPPHPAPTFLFPKPRISPFSISAKKIPQAPAKLSPPKNESITYTIVTTMKKQLSPSLPLPQHSPQKLPKSHHHISKQLGLTPHSRFPLQHTAPPCMRSKHPFFPHFPTMPFTFMTKLFVLPALFAPPYLAPSSNICFALFPLCSFLFIELCLSSTLHKIPFFPSYVSFLFCPPAYVLHALQTPRFLPPSKQFLFLYENLSQPI